MTDFVDGTAHSLPVRVYYQDTDAGGVVYHATYLNFAERARTEFLRERGFEMAELYGQRGLVFTIRHISADYAAPARLDDALVVKSAVTQIGGASFTAVQKIMRGDEMLCGLTVQLVLVGETGRPVRIPGDIRAALETPHL